MNKHILVHHQTHKSIAQFLQSPTHALGLSGEDGAGKGHVAQYIAAELLHITITSVDSHPYVLIIDTIAQKTGIEEIRELQKFLTLTVPGKAIIKRVIILEHMDNLGHEAQNALLKTLEEPPADTVIIVTYQRATSLLPTIVSRLQSIRVMPVDEITAKNHLTEYTEKDFAKAFVVSGGLAGLLIALLQDQANHPLIAGITKARELIGKTRYERLSAVDSVTKNPPLPPAMVLHGLLLLMNASYRQSLLSKSNDELHGVVTRIGLIEQAMNDLDSNVQAKIVFNRLFMEF